MSLLRLRNIPFEIRQKRHLFRNYHRKAYVASTPFTISTLVFTIVLCNTDVDIRSDQKTCFPCNLKPICDQLIVPPLPIVIANDCHVSSSDVETEMTTLVTTLRAH